MGVSFMNDNNMSCALTNPLNEILQKPAYLFSRSDLVRVIQTQGIERITFHYIALDGRLKELHFPVTDLYGADRILAEGERADGSSLFKGMVDETLSDLYIVPEYKTAFLNPFNPKSLDVICRYLTGDGERAPFALDSILSRANARFRQNTGLELYALGELEFFLIFEQNPMLYTAQPQKGYHAAAPFFKNGHMLDEMIRHIAQITGAVKYGHSEVGFLENIDSSMLEINGKSAEQMEVEFQPRPVEDMADYMVLSRWIIRNVAYRHGCIATFAPKLAEGAAGNGFHFHLDLRRDKKNIMRGCDGKLSSEALRLIGGLCEYADSLTGFGNMSASSYLRLVPNQEAPTQICWSDLNRSALIRVPLGWEGINDLAQRINPREQGTDASESRQTVELRSADGTALVHPLLAGIVMAADWAFQSDRSLELAQKLYAGPEAFKSGDVQENYPSLPANCLESREILLKKRELYEHDGIFPPGVIDYVASLLESEGKNQFDVNRIEDLEKIMHRDLHKH